MKFKSFEVEIGDPIQVGMYESVQAPVRVVAEVEEGEDPDAVFQSLVQEATRRYEQLAFERLAAVAKRRQLIPPDLDPRVRADADRLVAILGRFFAGKTAVP